MAYRIFMTVQRGMTDATAVCVFPWEKAILEEIHGGGAQEVSIDQMCALTGVAKVTVQKLKHAKAHAPDLRSQLQAMVKVDSEDNPFRDLATEYNRLAGCYGMHRDVNLPVVEKVYGSLATFRAAVARFNRSTPLPDEVEDQGDLDAGADEKPIAEMSVEELKAKLTADGIDFPKKPKAQSEDDYAAQLRDLLETATA